MKTFKQALIDLVHLLPDDVLKTLISDKLKEQISYITGEKIWDK